jgi:hypothetical protein
MNGVIKGIKNIGNAKKVAEGLSKVLKESKTVRETAQKFANGANKATTTLSQEVQWTNHGFKHFPQNNLSWQDIIKSTINGGKAKYKPGINIEAFERDAWNSGTSVASSVTNKSWKVKAFNDVCGACNGKETKYMRIEYSGGTIHGHPITEDEYLKLLKRK